MTGVPKITCAVCGKPVDRVTVRRNEADMSIEIIAECHGGKDRMSLPDVVLERTGPVEIERAISRGGVAFQTKRIEAREERDA